MATLLTTIKKMLRDVERFAEHASGLKLRKYQRDIARCICESVVKGLGLTFVVILPRQSGKNELQAQIEAYLLLLYSKLEGEMVKISPTWKPQSQNAMRRLERVLGKNLLVRKMWEKEQGYIYRIDTARMMFLSGAGTSNIVGATAKTLLECDEAQDVTIEKWDKEIGPMAASTNATRVFWGTAWTSQTLLAREKRGALEAERGDGVRRVFVVTADEVRKEVPAYGAYVDGEIAKLGRNHPFVRTQYYSEEVDGESGMFPAGRREMMKGVHGWEEGPVKGATYAFLLDVGGEELDGQDLIKAEQHDSTALTIVRLDMATVEDELIGAPRYLVVHRRVWTGARFQDVYGQIKALVEMWGPRYVVVDSTGIGAGLSSFLVNALNGKDRGGPVIPFVFTAKSKSELGWGFMAVIETGRYKEYDANASHLLRAYPTNLPDADPERLQEEFWRQAEACQMEIQPGPGKLVKWGNEAGHDDLVISAAMCAVLDGYKWGVGRSEVVKGVDPLEGMMSADFGREERSP